jgi:hypothetical protein
MKPLKLKEQLNTQMQQLYGVLGSMLATLRETDRLDTKRVVDCIGNVIEELQPLKESIHVLPPD